MVRRFLPRTADLRGAARLAADATAGLTDLVESMHERIANVPGLSKQPLDGRIGGIGGLVYKTVRGVTRVVGGSVDALLALLGPALDPSHPGPEREAIVAALNGVMGDYLASTSNPLATPMAFRRDGRALKVSRPALNTTIPDAGGKLLVMVHGLCMNDLQWSRDGHDHGAALARDLGFTQVYLHYNTGLHISANGRALAHQMESLVDQWPREIERLVVMGHSMGGLLARSAVHHAMQGGQRWVERLDDLVFLGSPHHGAPLERAGNWIHLLLGATRYSAPFTRLTRVRSAGITDLRHGFLVDEDWTGRDRFEHMPDQRQHLPLPEKVRCFAVAGSIGQRNGDLKERLLGDGLVPLDSALGRHKDPARCLQFAARRQWTGYGMNHLEMLGNAEVYAQLRKWLA
jgi:pimeloyl-ACP methyl ester carboxylesterase